MRDFEPASIARWADLCFAHMLSLRSDAVPARRAEPPPRQNATDPTVRWAVTPWRPARTSPGIYRGFLGAVAGIFGATGLFWLAARAGLSGPHDESLLYLPIVIFCSVRYGFGPAVFAAILSFVCWDFFFLSPRYTLTVAAVQDWIALLVFLTAAVTTAQLAARARRQADAAEAREREIAALYQVGQAVSSEVDAALLLPALAQQIRETCGAAHCVILRCASGDARTLLPAAVSAPEPLSAEARDRIHSVAVGAAAQREIVREGSGVAAGIYAPLWVEGAPAGVLNVGPRSDGTPFTADEERLIAALADQTDTLFVRQLLVDRVTREAQQAAVLEERNRLAREIHDTLAQGLTGIVVQLNAADACVDDAVARRAALAQVRTLAAECLREARRSVKALRPGGLEGRGLADAVQGMLARATEGGAVAPIGRFRVHGAPFSLPPDVEANLLRVAQEAVTNAIRHAEATVIQVEIAYAPSQVRLTIRDDGRGFDPAGRAGDGFGLTSMRERAAQMQAALTIHSEPTVGSVVAVAIPVSTRAAADHGENIVPQEARPAPVASPLFGAKEPQ
jgi:signal transduction histidine kinase